MAADTGTTAMVWTLVEPGVAITAACLVTMRPLLRTLNFRGFESDSAAQSTPLTLRNDISSGGHWSTISSRGERKKSFSMTAIDRLKTRHMVQEEGLVADSASEVIILDGIRRTVQVRVEHDRASQVGPG
jgi:hypothetical protein